MYALRFIFIIIFLPGLYDCTFSIILNITYMKKKYLLSLNIYIRYDRQIYLVINIEIGEAVEV